MSKRSGRRPPPKRPAAARERRSPDDPSRGVASPAKNEFRISVPAEVAATWQRPSADSAPAIPPEPALGKPAPYGADLHAPPAGGVEAYMARNAPCVVPVTYWFDPPAAEAVTVRFTGRRLDAGARPGPGDTFRWDERLTALVPGSGPVSVTAKVRGVNAGRWSVDARMVAQEDSEPAPDAAPRQRPALVPVHRGTWSWRHWRLSEGPAEPVDTCLAPFARPPAVVVGSWGLLVLAGILLALVTQWLVLSALGLRLEHVLTVSLPTVLAGAVGGRAWYAVLHRRTGRRNGWAVQGFVTAVILIAPALLAVLRVPPGPFLDASAPGLLFGLAVGRLGCFFTGCCAGRATASPWSVWSSNRRIGARRIPTQLLESGLALAVGLVILATVLREGPQAGALFVAAVATYTLIRQGVLQLREERRQSRRGSALVAAAAAIVAVGAVVVMIVGAG